jgi:isopenicillin N synthase-like dioxygenase
MENAQAQDFEGWRAGAHTDFDCLTLLHQKTGQGGLQVCPGTRPRMAHGRMWSR